MLVGTQKACGRSNQLTGVVAIDTTFQGIFCVYIVFGGFCLYRTVRNFGVAISGHVKEIRNLINNSLWVGFNKSVRLRKNMLKGQH